MRLLRHQLSPLSLKNVTAILKPNAVHFSPSLGLLRVTAPHTIANFRSSPQSGNLTNELYHQRSYIKDGILSNTPCRYGPVGITKSRSRAAYWLSPQVIGTVVGLAERAKKVCMVLFDASFCTFSKRLCLVAGCSGRRGDRCCLEGRRNYLQLCCGSMDRCLYGSVSKARAVVVG